MFNRVASRGFLYSCGIVINRLVPERLFRFRIFRIFELTPSLDRRAGDRQTVLTQADELTFRWCESDADFAAAQRLTFYRPPADLVDGTTQTAGPSRRCCLAVDWAEPIGGVWLADQYFDESDLGVRIRLRDTQTWLFAAFIAKSHRRRGIYRQLVNHVLGSEPPTTKTFASINPTNRASIAAHAPYVRRTVGTCVAIRVLGRSFCWTRGDLKTDRSKTPIEIEIR